jgi:hypothetical protein
LSACENFPPLLSDLPHSCGRCAYSLKILENQGASIFTLTTVILAVRVPMSEDPRAHTLIVMERRGDGGEKS